MHDHETLVDPSFPKPGAQNVPKEPVTEYQLLPPDYYNPDPDVYGTELSTFMGHKRPKTPGSLKNSPNYKAKGKPLGQHWSM